MCEASVRIFLNEDPQCVAMAIKGAAILEDADGELVPLVGFGAREARHAAVVLLKLADELDNLDE